MNINNWILRLQSNDAMENRAHNRLSAHYLFKHMH